ncbi:MAG: signal peptidase I [Desulfovibrio sp.]|jgi:signal peptidase I|nr:signal peptidase I [Desulfovibrio sp.]
MPFGKKKNVPADDPIAKLREWVEAIVIAVVLALFIRSFVVQAFKIPSGSMLETLQIGDHLLVSRFAYDIKVPFTNISIFPTGDPEHGDIIVFEYPEDPSKDFIKRIIGLPGDRIEIRDKMVYRNGKVLQEPYTQHSDPRILPSRRDYLAEFTVPKGKYFVLGDNRDDSRDSRFWGFVERDAIVGKAWILYWSWDRQDSSVRWDRIGDVLH